MIELYISPDEYARAAQSQRELAREMADKIERGEPLEHRMHRMIAAGILRLWADNLSDTAPRKPGQAPRVHAGEVAMQVAVLRVQGIAKTRAIAQVAEDLGVSDEAIRKALKKHGDEAMRFWSAGTNLKK